MVPREPLDSGIKGEKVDDSLQSSENYRRACRGMMKSDDVLAFQNLIDQGLNVHFIENGNDTLLMDAAFYKSEKIMDLLLTHQVSINETNEVGYTALLMAVSEGHIDMALKLINAGANVYAREQDGRDAFHLAVNNGHTDLVRKLLNLEAYTAREDDWGWAPVHQAARYGFADILELLVEHGADVNQICDDGSTPLHYAAGENKIEVIRVLIKHGAALDTLDHYKNSALCIAADQGFLDVVSCLVEHGANFLSSEESLLSPLETAQKQNHAHVVDYLQGVIQAQFEKNLLQDQFLKDQNVSLGEQNQTSETLPESLHPSKRSLRVL